MVSVENLEGTHTHKKRISGEKRAHIPTGSDKLAKTAGGVGVRATGHTGHITFPGTAQTAGGDARTQTAREELATIAEGPLEVATQDAKERTESPNTRRTGATPAPTEIIKR